MTVFWPNCDSAKCRHTAISLLAHIGKPIVLRSPPKGGLEKSKKMTPMEKELGYVGGYALNHSFVAPSAKKEGEGRFGYRFFKRAADILFSLLVLVLFLPIGIFVAIGAAISSKAMPIYRDERLGKDGKSIWVFKFRTMVKDAESNPGKYLNRSQMRQYRHERKVTNDPRVTRFGSLLRKTSIDEIPQFLNVLLGDMSLVGPRPVTKKEVYSNFSVDERSLVLSVRPGITGSWQVYGRNDDTWSSGSRKRLVMDYFSRRSLWYDAKLLMMTIPSCVGYSKAVNQASKNA